MRLFEFILLVIALGMVFTIIKHRMGIRQDREGNALGRSEDRSENGALRDEVRQLKERLAVLERITVEKENSLSREIEDLRGK